MAVLATNFLICSLCETEKPLSEFYSDKNAPLGYAGRCKACRSIYNADKKAFSNLSLAKYYRDERWIDEYRYHPVPSVRGEWPANEEWRGIDGYPAQYEVSNLGRIRSHWEYRHRNYYKRPIPKVLRHYQNTLGYQSVSLIDWMTGSKHTESVHALVCRTFNGACPPDKNLVGHRDGNPSNNNLSNLNWITFVENEEDKRRHGRALSGAKNHQAKLTDALVLQMRALWAAGGKTTREIGARFGVSGSVAHKIVVGKAWKHVA